MDLKEITLLVWDNPDNFKLESTKRLLGDGQLYKLKQFYSIKSFNTIWKKLGDNETLVFCCHVSYKDFKSYLDFNNSEIKEKYSIHHLINYVSSGDSGEAMKRLSDELGFEEKIIKYSALKRGIKAGEIIPFTKAQIRNGENGSISSIQPEIAQKEIQCEYAIVTALEEDEMAKVLPMITKEGRVPDDKHLIEYGYLESDPNKKIAYASQLETGMIEAAILATKMIFLFNPKFLIMCGVLGGKPAKTNTGDIIVSTKVFTIDKGKLTDKEFKSEIESANTANAYTTAFIRKKDSIKEYLKSLDQTRNRVPDIHFDPIACVRHVIDKKGYFIENISTVDRKTIGLEMESYGIVRTCELVNNGRTIPLIIKSVMDNTENKDDNAKTYAAWTSAMCVKFAIENGLI